MGDFGFRISDFGFGTHRSGFRALITTSVLVCLLCGFNRSAEAQSAQEQYRRASNALYNLDFSTARQGFETLTHQDPENPDYWNALASTAWLNILYDQQKLNLESYAGARFGTSDSKDEINPQDEARLRGNIALAISKAQAMLRKNPNDIRALYALGVSNATLASFEGTAKRSYRSALGKANQARDYHQRVLELNAGYTDALLTIGAYEFVSGSVPGWYRWILRAFGLGPGNKKEGIQKLEAVAAGGQRASTDAKNILLIIYNREKQFEKALLLSEDLHRRYPRNFLYELGIASFYGKMGRISNSIAKYRQVLAKVEAGQDGYERLRPERVYMEIGKANLGLNSQEAIAAFTRVARGETATVNEKADSHLWMGKIYDSIDQRAKALQQYGAVLALDCDEELRNEAERYQRRPFSGND